MANYATLKTAIQQVVKTNGNEEITGALLQQSLLAMINSLGGYYQFAGIATPSTNPGTPDQNVYYIASTAGTYSNFNGITLANGEIAILKYNGAWSKDSTGAASLEKVSQLGQEVDESQYLQDASVLDFRPGYISGTSGNPYSVVASTTRHYCIIPARAGLSDVVVMNATAYRRADIDKNGNIITFFTNAEASVSATAKYLAFNFEDSDNSYSGVKILQAISLAEQNRFHSDDYNCFQRYSTNQDKDYWVGAVGNRHLYSECLRSFISLKLIGFNKENPHYVRAFTRNHGTNHNYRIIIWEYSNGSWARTFDATVRNVEANGAQNGVNTVVWTSGTKTVKAVVDYSFVPENYEIIMAVQAYIIKPECFNDFDALDTQVQTLQVSALLKSMLGYSVFSDNIANPADIQVDSYVRSDGVVAPQTGWAVGSAPVVAGQKVTFGGCKLGRSGYYRFQDANGNRVSYGIYTDPNFRANPITLDVPATAVLLFVDIASTSSPSDPYDEFQVNIGETLLPYDEYKSAISSINNEPLAGGVSKELEERVSDLEDEVTELNEEITLGLASVIADLPVSDGTDISVGYAYIESGTGAVKVKLS